MKLIHHSNTIIIVLSILFSFSFLNAQDNWTRTNPGGGGATSMITATAGGKILSGSDLSGVYMSDDNGATWSVLGSEQGLTKTEVVSLAPHYKDEDVFLIGTGEGIYKTTNGGDSAYATNIEFVNGLGYVEAMELAPSDGQIGYAAHHEWWDPTMTLLTTTDGGDNWNIHPTTGLPVEASILKISVTENDPNTVYVLTGKSRYNCSDPWLYRSSDGGSNWTRIGIGLNDILDFDLHPTDNNSVYASTFSANDCSAPIWNYVMGSPSTGAFFKSTNGGVDFEEIGPNTGFISVGSNPDNIAVTNFLFPIDYSGSTPVYNSQMGTWKTINGGTNWSMTGDLPNWITGWPVLNYAYVSSFYGLNKTITKDRNNPDKVYGAFGGYAWTSLDGGDNFTNIATNELSTGKFLSTGMDNINGNSIDVSDINPNTIYVGYYDLGFWYSRDHGKSWSFSLPDPAEFPDHVWGGGGGANANFVLNDPAREAVVWATFGVENVSTKGAIFKSTAFGEDWQWSNNGLDSLGRNTHGMSIDINSPVNNRTLYVTQDGDVYKSIDDGNSWTLTLDNGGLKFTAVDQYDSQLIYAGGENGLWRSIDAGSNWTEVGLVDMRFTRQFPNSVMRDDIVPTNSIPWSNPPVEAWNGVFEIKTDVNNPNTVFVSVYGKDKGLYKSIDAGMNWAKLYTNDWLRGIAIDPNDSNNIYISSGAAYHSGGYETGSEGVLFSEDGGISWTSVNKDMSWPFAGRMEVETGNNQHLWAWSPGTGVQYLSIDTIVDASNDIVDADNDTINADSDCDDSDATIGEKQIPGTSCDDGDVMTENDAIQTDSCSCMGIAIVPSGCTAPINPVASTINPRSINIDWSAIPNAINYTIQIRFKDGVRWLVTKTLRTNKVRVVGPLKNYEYRIKSNCENGDSEYSSIYEFSIPTSNLKSNASSRSGDPEEILIQESATLYPNPVKNTLNLFYPAVADNTNFVVYNITGKVVYQHKMAVGTDSYSFPLDHLDAGYYIGIVEENGKRRYADKFVKQ